MASQNETQNPMGGVALESIMEAINCMNHRIKIKERKISNMKSSIPMMDGRMIIWRDI